MNLLSLFSAMLAAAFLIGGVYCLTRGRKSILNVFSFLVLLFLGWWSFCNAFFFSAETTEELWRWHHLAAVGWTGFIAETTYYFLALTGIREKMKKLWIQVAFYALPGVLLFHNLFGTTTSLAYGFTRSNLGGQWTYVNSVDNPWLWFYLVCLVLYFGVSFFLLLRWAVTVKHRLKRRMAVSFVALDALTILVGFATDVLFPLTVPLTPAIANLSTAIFGAGYFLIIIRFDLFNLNNVVADRDILDHSMGAVMVTDEVGEILYFNPACGDLLETERIRLIGQNVAAYFGAEQYQEKLKSPLTGCDALQDVELILPEKGNGRKRLLASAAVIRDRQREYLGTVISLRDITQLSQLKEWYQLQSDRFEKLAFLDPLTGLPNRRKTFEKLNECASAYENGGNDFFLLYVDLDYFKSINDRYGHQVGDQFLVAVTERLSSCLSDTMNFLGRLGGDELLLIGSGDTSEQSIEACIAKLRGAFTSAFQVGEHNILSSISIGSARFSDHKDVDAAVHCADEQMYGAKQEMHTKTRGETRQK